MKKIALSLIITILLIPMFVSAEIKDYQVEWNKTIGGDKEDSFVDVIATKDGGTLSVGSTKSTKIGDKETNANESGLIVKRDANGIEQWSQVITTDSDSWANSAVESSTGTFYVIVSLEEGQSGIIKIDENGKIESESTLSPVGIILSDITIIKNGNIVVVGEKENTSTNDGYIGIYNSSLTLLTSDSFGGTNYEIFTGISPTSDEGFIVTGQTDSNVTNTGILVNKYDDELNLEWTKTFDYGATTAQAGSAITETSDGGYIIVGSQELNSTNGYGFVLKITSTGTQEWFKKYGDTSKYSSLNDVVLTLDNYIVTVGYAKGSEYEAVIAVYDENGNYMFDKSIETTNSTIASSVSIDENNFIYVSGETQVTTSNWDAMTIKLAPIFYKVIAIENETGKINLNKKQMIEGEIVTFTVEPLSGFTINTLTVLDSEKNEIEYTEEEGTYSFTMPASDVTIEATYKSIEKVTNPETGVYTYLLEGVLTTIVCITLLFIVKNKNKFRKI